MAVFDNFTVLILIFVLLCATAMAMHEKPQLEEKQMSSDIGTKVGPPPQMGLPKFAQIDVDLDSLSEHNAGLFWSFIRCTETADSEASGCMQKAFESQLDFHEECVKKGSSVLECVDVAREHYGGKHEACATEFNKAGVECNKKFVHLIAKVDAPDEFDSGDEYAFALLLAYQKIKQKEQEAWEEEYKKEQAAMRAAEKAHLEALIKPRLICQNKVLNSYGATSVSLCKSHPGCNKRYKAC